PDSDMGRRTPWCLRRPAERSQPGLVSAWLPPRAPALARASPSSLRLPRRSEALRRLPPSGAPPPHLPPPSAAPRPLPLSAAPRPPRTFGALPPHGPVAGLRLRPTVEPLPLLLRAELGLPPPPDGEPRSPLPPRAAPRLPLLDVERRLPQPGGGFPPPRRAVFLLPLPLVAPRPPRQRAAAPLRLLFVELPPRLFSELLLWRP